MPAPNSVRAGRAFVELDTQDKLSRGLSRAQAKLRAFGRVVGRIGRSMALVGGAGVAAVLASARAFARMGDSVAKMARRTGLSAETISELAAYINENRRE